ncbi:hypothetical protein D0X99_10505 [Algoriphagus lacus]|uniref:Uncharacterized protein n=2 Tax=Algoriphagus lacus TaxID=2056311 RepID=A0A418PSH4_9BACT|nr:hypothetical protein D0X99_10505 [Algoriphagus lacus]
MSEVEAPVANEMAKTAEESSEVISGGENLRKAPNGVFYQEKFTNQIFLVGDEASGWSQGAPAPAWYPGTGFGNATHMGNAYSFINQYATLGPNGLSTVGAPVTQFFESELADLGLTGIPDAVSSLTTDGKGNAIYFKNVLNVTTPASPTRINFVAQVEIIGGTGIYKTATGTGEVNGYFNPQDGKGETTLRANIVF